MSSVKEFVDVLFRDDSAARGKRPEVSGRDFDTEQNTKGSRMTRQIKQHYSGDKNGIVHKFVQSRVLARLGMLSLLVMGGVGCATTQLTSAGEFDHVGEERAAGLRPMPRPDMPSSYPLSSPASPMPQARPQTVMRSPWAPNVAARKWRYIVVHHSASPTGSASAFDREHRANRGWDELGYHFVIGNGRGSADGAVEVGPRWWKQKYGAHAKTADNRFNDFGIGICLVGNFDVTRPTAKQQQELVRLVAWLMETYDVPRQNIIGHRDTKSTACPGKFMNLQALRQRASQAIIAEGREVPGAQFARMTSRTELLSPNK